MCCWFHHSGSLASLFWRMMCMPPLPMGMHRKSKWAIFLPSPTISLLASFSLPTHFGRQRSCCRQSLTPEYMARHSWHGHVKGICMVCPLVLVLLLLPLHCDRQVNALLLQSEMCSLASYLGQMIRLPCWLTGRSSSSGASVTRRPCLNSSH